MIILQIAIGIVLGVLLVRLLNHLGIKTIIRFSLIGTITLIFAASVMFLIAIFSGLPSDRKIDVIKYPAIALIWLWILPAVKRLQTRSKSSEISPRQNKD